MHMGGREAGVFEVIRKGRPLWVRAGRGIPVLGTELSAGLQAPREQEVVVLLEQLPGEGAAASERSQMAPRSVTRDLRAYRKSLEQWPLSSAGPRGVPP